MLTAMLFNNYDLQFCVFAIKQFCAAKKILVFEGIFDAVLMLFLLVYFQDKTYVYSFL